MTQQQSSNSEPASGEESTPVGFEYRSKFELFGLPLVHICFKYRYRRGGLLNRGFLPFPAKGVIAIGQVAFGVISISQFGAGVFVLSQFAIGGIVIAQFAAAFSAIAQFGLVLYGSPARYIVSMFG